MDETREPNKPDTQGTPGVPAPAPPGGRSVAAADPLSAYIASLRGVRQLSEAEERAFAVRLRESGDLEAARALVTAHLMLVVKIAIEHRRYCDSVMDMIQEGNVGLMMAVKRFDPQRNVRLAAYAAYWIKGYIRRYIARTRPTPLPADGSELLVPAAEPAAEQLLIEDESTRRAREAFYRALATLNPRQQDIVRSRHLDEERTTLETLASRHGISIERVRQIERQALHCLKNETIARLGGIGAARGLLAPLAD